MTRTEWLKQRQNGIGGSEAAAIMGMNPYMTNAELWEYKTGKRVRADVDNEYMRYGREAEKPLIELFALDYPDYRVTIPKSYTLIMNPNYPFILGTVDGNLEEIMPIVRKGFLEVKTTFILASNQKERWNERVPDNYYIQLLHYLLVNPEYQFCWLKAQLKSEWKNDSGKKEIRLTTKHYYFERAEVEEDLKILLEKEVEFWEKYVMKDIRPPLVLPAI
ncbi:MAG: YqaJ viral recombinase family protein [Endomicrobium sp.]|jgi:putative phage-type endonuclease|nr:YqaJ viral recombinase family protein [Endomicrobium sp.]